MGYFSCIVPKQDISNFASVAQVEGGRPRNLINVGFRGHTVCFGFQKLSSCSDFSDCRIPQRFTQTLNYKLKTDTYETKSALVFIPHHPVILSKSFINPVGCA